MAEAQPEWTDRTGLPRLLAADLLAGKTPQISPAVAKRTIWVIRLELLLLVCLPFLASLMAQG